MVDAAAIAASSYTYHLSPITYHLSPAACRPPSGNDYDEIRLTGAYFELERGQLGWSLSTFCGLQERRTSMTGSGFVFTMCEVHSVLGPAVSKMLS